MTIMMPRPWQKNACYERAYSYCFVFIGVFAKCSYKSHLNVYKITTNSVFWTYVHIECVLQQ